MKRFFPSCWPKTPPIYDCSLSYEENFSQGPFCNIKPPARLPIKKELWPTIFDLPIASRIGVPAGPLLNSKWVKFASDFGFDILTYRPIYKKSNLADPLPNIYYIDPASSLEKIAAISSMEEIRRSSSSINDLTIAHAFGSPCKDKEFLLKDLQKAKSYLHEGQVLVASVEGEGNTEKELIEDFSYTSSIAYEGGADIIELNFAHPALITSKIWNKVLVKRVLLHIHKKFQKIPLIVKLPYCPNPFELKEIIMTIASFKVRGICGINTLTKKVKSKTISSSQNINFLKMPISGSLLRKDALAFVRVAAYTIFKEKLDIMLFAAGGAVEAHHFNEFLISGADIALSGTGMIWDPLLAARFHSKKVV
ncbi:Dihydroorotate dehydrogenase [Candidatus Clavichlamydia salmonicola]|uniref:hypothetical protein n=1 Tax=Candidatus Clavichlamydia salmonicola TaxID=469812 RepID=UPI0018911F49|nr:hypothetical protein [Candidatus Clavichlamydia salmonicola]MBF5050988.1 Dihydroorotate dehydrogenase [Candidatus Clavichlamydia salmonicola]